MTTAIHNDDIINSKLRYLHYISVDENSNVKSRWVSRKWLASAAVSAVQSIQHFLNFNQLFGVRITHNMTENSLEEVVLRKAAMFCGYVPVTVNWQADNVQKIAYKAECTNSALVICSDTYDEHKRQQLEGLLQPAIKVIRCSDLFTLRFDDKFVNSYHPPTMERRNVESTEQMINFTSGTTADPKGVITTYNNYVVSEKAFKQLLNMNEDTYFVCILVNPLHHANSTCFLRWVLTDPNCEVHLFNRYSSTYWYYVCEVLEYLEGPLNTRRDYRVVMPLVSKHIEYLSNLVSRNALGSGLSLEKLKRLMAPQNVVAAMGSAPVPEATIRQFQSLFGGKVPLIRFGSTESCLQICATPFEFSAAEMMRYFDLGWKYEWEGKLKKSNYIGRSHYPHTDVKIVKSTNRSDRNYMVECTEGETGEIVYRGGNTMMGYVNHSRLPFSDDGWYLGLGDVGFYLTTKDEKSGGVHKELYWQSRDSEMLIIGGANYSYTQVSDDVKRLLLKHFEVPTSDVQVATVGVHATNEYDDDCCITVEVAPTVDKQKKEAMQATILELIRNDAETCVGCKPKFVQFQIIPRNFKGSIEYKTLKVMFNKLLKPQHSKL